MNNFFLGRLVIVGTLCSCMLLPAISVQAAPRGARMLVRSYFSVTNSDDGALDRNVEVFGTVNYNGSTVWSVASKNDAMWNPFSMPQIVNLKQINERFPMSKRSGLYTLPGDRDIESADLVMVINWAGDIN